MNVIELFKKPVESNIYKTIIYDFSYNSKLGSFIDINNIGDYPIKPIINIKIDKTLPDNEIILIPNLKNEKSIILSNLKKETIIIDCENKTITTNEFGRIMELRCNNKIKNGYIDKYDFIPREFNWIELPVGYNYLQLIGDCKIQLEYIIKYKGVNYAYKTYSRMD